MRKSILFLSNAYPDFDSSYRGIFIKKMATLLRADGQEVSVVTPKIYRESRFFEDQNGVKVYRFPFFSGNKRLIEYERVPYFRMSVYYLTGFFLTLYVMLRQRSCLVHVHWAIPTGLIGAWVGSLLRKPLVVTIHGSDFRMAQDKPGFLRKIFLFVCKKARHLICVSEVQKEWITEQGIDVKKISVSPMGIDERFLEVGGNRRKRMDDRPFMVLSNRNLFPIYNVSLLIKAVPLVLKEEPMTQFVIAGDGPERGELERLAKDLNLDRSVRFLGQVPHEEIPGLLGEADIYVSTSLHDGASVSLLEAMGSGDFPIVTDIPANREWISHGENGFLVPFDQGQSLAKRIVEAIRDQWIIEKSRDKNLHLVEKMAMWSFGIKETEEIYTRILSASVV